MPTKAPPTHSAAAPSRSLLSPFCGELRSKKFFMLNTMATEAGARRGQSGSAAVHSGT